MTSVFSEDAVTHLGNNYHTKVRPEHGGSSRGGCMKAVYIGLGSLFGPDFDFRGAFHKSFFRKARKEEKRLNLPEGRRNTIDRVFRALEDEGIAFDEQTFKPTGDKWEIDDGFIVDSLEETLVEQVMPLPDGSHFFGVAVNDAIHSVLLRIEKIGEGATVFWMDQFADGYDAVRRDIFVDRPNVTGKLDDTIRGIKGNKNKTSVWLFDPEGALAVGIEVDIDGDGVADMSVPAVDDV